MSSAAGKVWSVLQDGADFYCRPHGEVNSFVMTYPHKVRDFDLDAARNARKWFLGQLPERVFVQWQWGLSDA